MNFRRWFCRLGLHRQEVLWRGMFGYRWRCVDCGKEDVEAGP